MDGLEVAAGAACIDTRLIGWALMVMKEGGVLVGATRDKLGLLAPMPVAGALGSNVVVADRCAAKVRRDPKPRRLVGCNEA